MKLRCVGNLMDLEGNRYRVENPEVFSQSHDISAVVIRRLLRDPNHFIIAGFYNCDRYWIDEQTLNTLQPLLKPYLSTARSKNTPFNKISTETQIPFMIVKFYYCYFCELMRRDIAIYKDSDQSNII